MARSYVRELSVGSSNDPTAVANDSGPDDYSPRDRSGHGTAIASVIAGNQITGPAVPFSGMAPKAWLGNYRVERGASTVPRNQIVSTVKGLPLRCPPHVNLTGTPVA